MSGINKPILKVENIHTSFGSHVVHEGVSFEVLKGEVVSVIGGSGCGKSTLLREAIGLLRPSKGSMVLLGQDVWQSSGSELSELRKRFGVLFQNSALFSALTVGENVALPLKENKLFKDSSSDVIKEIVELNINLSGLDSSVIKKMPSELSGGMKKRAALARALVLEPEILFLDEPTSGLDPVSARKFDKLIQTLSNSLGLSVFMVSHDLDSISAISDRVVVLADKKVVANDSYENVVKVKHPWIEEYFSTRTN